MTVGQRLKRGSLKPKNAGNKEQDVPGTSRRNQPCHHFDFSPIGFIADFWPQETQDHKLI